MSDQLHEALMKLEIKEFFSRNFVKAVMEKKKLNEESVERKALGDKMPSLYFNALYSAMRSDVKRGLETAGKEAREPIVEDLLALTPNELLRIPYFGKKGLRWIETYLTLFGLHLANSSFTIDYAFFTPKAKKALDLIK